MEYMKMKYKGFEFDVNPKEFELIAKKNMSKVDIPNKSFINDEVNPKGLLVKGKGCFVGANALEKAHLLLLLFNKSGSDFLFLPTGDVVKAYFTNLDISYSGSLDKVEYSFEFLEDTLGKDTEHTFGYTFAKRQENMFDVSNRTGVEVETLAKINQVQSVFAIKEGDKIWLM